MERIIVVWGTGAVFRNIIDSVRSKYSGCQILAVDMNSELWGNAIDGVSVFNPDELLKNKNCIVVIATAQGYETVRKKLIEVYNFCEEDIDDSYAKKRFQDTFGVRYTFLEYCSSIINERNIQGSCAEGGVFEGEFAKEINKLFPNRVLYLFDTFEGFDDRDLKLEDEEVSKRKSGYKCEGMTTELILDKMAYPNKIIIKKGYFPDTTEGIEDQFAFVNLDFDLYAPTLSGLEYFWPRMSKGGILLVHDYFGAVLDGKYGFTKVKQAVDEFANKYNITFVPIGDMLSICFIKQ